MKACLQCGNLIADEAKFCDQCGTPSPATASGQGQTLPKEPKKIKKACAFCNGKGVRPGAVFVSEHCPTCKGNRFNLINEDARPCEICGGTGRVPPKGMVIMGPNFVRCPACGGTGWD